MGNIRMNASLVADAVGPNYRSAYLIDCVESFLNMGGFKFNRASVRSGDRKTEVYAMEDYKGQPRSLPTIHVFHRAQDYEDWAREIRDNKMGPEISDILNLSRLMLFKGRVKNVSNEYAGLDSWQFPRRFMDFLSRCNLRHIPDCRSSRIVYDNGKTLVAGEDYHDIFPELGIWKK